MVGAMGEAFVAIAFAATEFVTDAGAAGGGVSDFLQPAHAMIAHRRMRLMFFKTMFRVLGFAFGVSSSNSNTEMQFEQEHAEIKQEETEKTEVRIT